MSTISSSAASSAKNEIAEQLKAQQAEKEKIQAQEEAEIERLKNNYETQKAELTDRFEKSIQNDKQKYYENVRNNKSQLNRAQNDLEQKSTEVIAHQKDSLIKEQIDADNSGKKIVDETKRKHAIALEYEQKQAHEAEMLVRNGHKKTAEGIIKDSEGKIGDLYAAKQAELQTASKTNAAAIQQINTEMNRQQGEVATQYTSQLKNLQDKTQGDLNQRRVQNAQLLSAYSARQSDPFYQLARYDSEITDTGDAYVVRVKVPEHERDKFRVQVFGQELQLSGTRTNNEKAELHPGNWISTSSYQSFTERYPLPTPVDAKTLTTRHDGEWLEYSIDKYGPKHHIGDANPVRLGKNEREMITQVDFPDSLPKASILQREKAKT